MLISFYSTFIAFIMLFLITLVVIVIINRKKSKDDRGVGVVMLVVLSIGTLIVSIIYGYDFIQLNTEQQRVIEGKCDTKFINGHGKSIDTTEITIEGKIYTIKSARYKNLKDDTYYCSLSYLPITKTISEIEIIER